MEKKKKLSLPVQIFIALVLGIVVGLMFYFTGAAGFTTSYIKPFVNTLDHRVMFAEKSWGSFKVIDIDKASMTIKVTLNAGHRMNYHSHQHRDEVWTVIAGEGKTIVDGMEQNVKAGDVITMSAGCRHTVIAETELKLIEVQLGEAIDVHDKQKFELEY